MLSQLVTLRRQSQQYQLLSGLRDRISNHRQAIAAMNRSLTELSTTAVGGRKELPSAATGPYQRGVSATPG